MHHDNLSNETISSFAAVSPGATVPQNLIGTRAALFHLLKEVPRRDTVPPRIFGGSGAGSARQGLTDKMHVPQARNTVAQQYHATTPSHAQRFWRDMLMEDNFNFVKFGA